MFIDALNSLIARFTVFSVILLAALIIAGTILAVKAFLRLMGRYDKLSAVADKPVPAEVPRKTGQYGVLLESIPQALNSKETIAATSWFGKLEATVNLVSAEIAVTEFNGQRMTLPDLLRKGSGYSVTGKIYGASCCTQVAVNGRTQIKALPQIPDGTQVKLWICSLPRGGSRTVV